MVRLPLASQMDAMVQRSVQLAAKSSQLPFSMPAYCLRQRLVRVHFEEPTTQARFLLVFWSMKSFRHFLSFLWVRYALHPAFTSALIIYNPTITATTIAPGGNATPPITTVPGTAAASTPAGQTAAGQRHPLVRPQVVVAAGATGSATIWRPKTTLPGHATTRSDSTPSSS